MENLQILILINHFEMNYNLKKSSINFKTLKSNKSQHSELEKIFDTLTIRRQLLDVGPWNFEHSNWDRYKAFEHKVQCHVGYYKNNTQQMKEE